MKHLLIISVVLLISSFNFFERYESKTFFSSGELYLSSLDTQIEFSADSGGVIFKEEKLDLNFELQCYDSLSSEKEARLPINGTIAYMPYLYVTLRRLSTQILEWRAAQIYFNLIAKIKQIINLS